MNKQAKNNLDYLNKFQPGFKVQKFIDFPGRWLDYDSEDYYNFIEENGDVNHREILEDEIVIDVDAEVVKDGKIHADMVEKRLKDKKYKYKRYKSGGNGEHFHLIFNKLYLLFPDINLDSVKYAIIEYILKDIINPDNLDSHICLFKKKLIQIEFVKHRKGGIKTLRPGGSLGYNLVPDEFFTFIAIKMGRIQNIQKRIDSIKQPDNLNCISYFEGHVINGEDYYSLKRINYRTLFAMASYFKSRHKTEELTKEKLVEWYGNIPVPLRRASLSTVNHHQINTLSKRSNGSAGCIYRLGLLEELGIENKICKNCPYYFNDDN